MKFGYVTKFLIKIRPGLQEVQVLFLAKAAATLSVTALFMDHGIYGLCFIKLVNKCRLFA